MSSTLVVPDFWMLFDPDGKADGSTRAVVQGEIRHATAESAHAMFTPNKRTRERETRQGWRVIGVEQADWNDYWTGVKKPGPEPKEAPGA
ncbi:hypothetical protein [Mycetocola saprophilus]|uniref:hypothetical protein n=1 Tax=Mycetocola saprophilus TaxID=76636 RepID=UPI0004C145B5|nr:hypothetical protein [Mycetocola saprophilus]